MRMDDNTRTAADDASPHLPHAAAEDSPAGDAGPRTLAIDIGGSHLKASVLDAAGAMLAERVRIATPRPATPGAVLEALAGLVPALPSFDRISVGFPGVVRDGRILTAPNLGTEEWRSAPLAAALADLLGRPTRVLNDADVQGLGTIAGQGLECVLTLGTGIGCALFRNGRLLPHLELGQHPIRTNKTYDRWLGDVARRKKGDRKWNRRLRKAIPIVRTFLNFDLLYLGGGNAKRIEFELPPDVRLAANTAGITGGVRLWHADLAEVFAAALTTAAAPSGQSHLEPFAMKAVR